MGEASDKEMEIEFVAGEPSPVEEEFSEEDFDLCEVVFTFFKRGRRKNIY